MTANSLSFFSPTHTQCFVNINNKSKVFCREHIAFILKHALKARFCEVVCRLFTHTHKWNGRKLTVHLFVAYNIRFTTNFFDSGCVIDLSHANEIQFRIFQSRNPIKLAMDCLDIKFYDLLTTRLLPISFVLTHQQVFNHYYYTIFAKHYKL